MLVLVMENRTHVCVSSSEKRKIRFLLSRILKNYIDGFFYRINSEKDTAFLCFFLKKFNKYFIHIYLIAIQIRNC